MNRREFLAISSTAGLGMLTGSQILASGESSETAPGDPGSFKLLPYPQELVPLAGVLRLGNPAFTTTGPLTRTKEIAMDCLRRFLPHQGERVAVRLGSLEEGYDVSWLGDEEADFLVSEKAALRPVSFGSRHTVLSRSVKANGACSARSKQLTR